MFDIDNISKIMGQNEGRNDRNDRKRGRNDRSVRMILKADRPSLSFETGQK